MGQGKDNWYTLLSNKIAQEVIIEASTVKKISTTVNTLNVIQLEKPEMVEPTGMVAYLDQTKEIMAIFAQAGGMSATLFALLYVFNYCCTKRKFNNYVKEQREIIRKANEPKEDTVEEEEE